MHYLTLAGVGEYVASEGHQFILPKFYKPDATRRPIIFCHGIFGTYTNWLTAAGALELIVLARCGLPVVACDLGGISTWGNDTTQTRIGQAWTFAKTRLTCKTDKFILYLQSQGAPGGLNYARANPSNVAAIAGECPVIGVDSLHDRGNLSGADPTLVSLSDAVDGAYGSEANWEAAKATHDPLLNKAAYNGDGIPKAFWCPHDDQFADYADAQAFAAANGAEIIDMGSGGHRVLDEAFWYDVATFLRPYVLP